MKRLLFIAFPVLVSFALFGQNYHENHEVFGINKEAPHAHLFPFENETLALNGQMEDSKWFQSLNGYWKFNWVKNPQLRPIGFFQEEFDDKEWELFPVPANWEVHGYGYPISLDEKYRCETQWPDGSDEYSPVG
ncbi:MAG: beta-galactosidase, partial [Bacteroidetes bacterium]